MFPDTDGRIPDRHPAAAHRGAFVDSDAGNSTSGTGASWQ